MCLTHHIRRYSTIIQVFGDEFSLFYLLHERADALRLVVRSSLMSTGSGGQRPKTYTRRPGLFLHDACLDHGNIRSSQAFLERPERLRAVNFGIAATGTYARLEETTKNLKARKASSSRRTASSRDTGEVDPLTIVRSTAMVGSISPPTLCYTSGRGKIRIIQRMWRSLRSGALRAGRRL